MVDKKTLDKRDYAITAMATQNAGPPPKDIFVSVAWQMAGAHGVNLITLRNIYAVCLSTTICVHLGSVADLTSLVSLLTGAILSMIES